MGRWERGKKGYKGAEEQRLQRNRGSEGTKQQRVSRGVYRDRGTEGTEEQ